MKMGLGNKRGSSVANIIVGIFIFLLVLLVGLSMYNHFAEGMPFAGAVESSMSGVGEVSMAVLNPLFGSLLGLDGKGTDIQFLIVLTFIMIAIILVGVLDSLNLFGEEGKGKAANFLIGIIVALIGVRFMPENLWEALTAPSSAFVATILVGAPFLALAMITIKIKQRWVSKLIWLFYVVFMGYLLISKQSEVVAVTWAYATFLILGLVLLFADAQVKRFFYKEQYKAELEDMFGKLDIQKRHQIREAIRKWEAILEPTSGASPRDRGTAKSELIKLRKQYGQDLSQI